MARDLTWGPVQANDGRRVYISEAGQRDYHIPAVWADRLEDKVELRKAAYKYAQEIERQVDELSAEEEEEEPPLAPAPRSTSNPIGKMSEQPTASSPEAYVFRGYKKIKTLVREKRSEESSEDYIKDVWPMITNATENDEARYVKPLREVTKRRKGEIAFAKMPMQGTTVPQMDQAVISYDMEQQFYEERRKKETGQRGKPPTEASVKAPANPPNRPPPQRREEPQRRFYGPPASQGPQKKSTFLPREEYDKLSSEEKKALFESHRSGTEGPAK
ncbi:hypothetical protein XENOCAPTIV_012469 [Xenoophorus captivus]|uniref:Uncharacterized protein n=1 Tax=Xenoophorus captivus TaxID=1517983 RepID=A0ABV0R1C2_9TELE